MPRENPNTLGSKYGRWLVIGKAKSKGGTRWLCRCECGNERVISFNSLSNNRSKSCGCLNTEMILERAKKSKGHSKHPLYFIWKGMLRRCFNPNSHAWNQYGGRGITVSEEWLDFEAFASDMGLTVSGMSLERKDNDGPYSKNNCRWATAREQGINRRSCRFVEIDGGKMCVAEAARTYGIAARTVYARLAMGWDPIHAIKVPVSRSDNWMKYKRK